MPRQLRRVLRALRSPSGLIRAGYGFIQHVNTVTDFLSALATLAGLFGTGAATGAFSLPGIEIDRWPFPLRLVVFLVLACGMGWAFGAVLLWLRRLSREPRQLLSVQAAVIMAGLVAGCADWLGKAGGRSPLPQLAAMMVIGTLGATRAAVFSLDVSRGRAAEAGAREASTMLLVFALASAAMLAFAELGVR